VPVIDGANLARNAWTALQTAKSNLNEALMIKQQLDGLVQDALHLKRLPESLINQMQGMFQDYRQILTRTEGIGYSLYNAGVQFDQLYGRAQDLTQDIPAMAGQWIGHIQTAARTATEAQAVTQQLERLQAQYGKALALSDRAEGSLQAQQASNQLLGIMGQQQAALLELQATTARLETAVYARWGAGEAAAAAQADALLARERALLKPPRPLGQTQGELTLPDFK
jgi:P-type conjugative transfer protein TrbJ